MAADLVRTKPGVNILKKVKVGGVWKLCPAILDASGKLKDKVRVGGSVEPHSEGTYYIQWRENGRTASAGARLFRAQRCARAGAPQNSTAAKPVIAPAEQPIAQPAACFNSLLVLDGLGRPLAVQGQDL